MPRHHPAKKVASRGGHCHEDTALSLRCIYEIDFHDCSIRRRMLEPRILTPGLLPSLEALHVPRSS